MNADTLKVRWASESPNGWQYRLCVDGARTPYVVVAAPDRGATAWFPTGPKAGHVLQQFWKHGTTLEGAKAAAVEKYLADSSTQFSVRVVKTGASE